MNTKFSEVQNKILDTNGLVTTTVFNKKKQWSWEQISDFSSLVKKTDYDAKILDTEGKYFTTSNYKRKYLMQR